MTELPTYVLERTFAAPPELVWRAWTETALFARWYGPNIETIIHQQDLRVGGECRIEMRWSGNSSYQKLIYREVSRPSRLVWLHFNADANWTIAANPQMPDWPHTLLTTVTFDPDGAQTQMRLQWTPHDASDAETACFAAAMGNMGKGWDAGMEILATILAELQRPSA